MAWRPAALTAFLQLDDPAGQVRRWHRELDGRGLRLLLGASLRPAGALAGGVSPAFRGALPGRFDEVMRTRLARGLARHPNAGNPWAWRLLLGRSPEDDSAPAPVPDAAVRFLVADVAEHLERSPAGHYDAVTLSNVLDRPGSTFARRLDGAVRHGVRPGGVAVVTAFAFRKDGAP